VSRPEAWPFARPDPQWPVSTAWERKSKRNNPGAGSRPPPPDPAPRSMPPASRRAATACAASTRAGAIHFCSPDPTSRPRQTRQKKTVNQLCEARGDISRHLGVLRCCRIQAEQPGLAPSHEEDGHQSPGMTLGLAPDGRRDWPAEAVTGHGRGRLLMSVAPQQRQQPMPSSSTPITVNSLSCRAVSPHGHHGGRNDERKRHRARI